MSDGVTVEWLLSGSFIFVKVFEGKYLCENVKQQRELHQTHHNISVNLIIGIESLQKKSFNI